MYYIMANAWMSHLNNTRRKNPGMSLSQAMKKASKTYKKNESLITEIDRLHPLDQ